MSEYINKESVIITIDRALGRVFTEPVGRNVLEGVPTIDIVFCFDCRHWHEDSHWLCDIWSCFVTNPYFYCGCGISRGGDNK